MYGDFGGKQYGHLPVLIGNSRRRIFAGPYKQKPSGVYGIKLAEEIDLPADFDLPIRDFDVPRDLVGLRTVLAIALDRLARGQATYVGCMGGRGRTGLFLAILAKVTGVLDPVTYVRKFYNEHAVETREQQRFVAQLDIEPLSFALWKAAGTALLTDLAAGRHIRPLIAKTTLTQQANLA